MPVSLSLTAIPSTFALGPPRGRAIRRGGRLALPRWPLGFPGQTHTQTQQPVPTAPSSRLPVSPRRITATRQARPRAGRSGRPRGGPRLKARNSRERNNQAPHTASVTKTQNEGAPNSYRAGCRFLCRSRLFQALPCLGLRGGALTGRRPLGLASLVARITLAHAHSEPSAGATRLHHPVCPCIRAA